MLTALPALLVSHIPGLGPNSILDTIRSNCQKFLAAKWSPLFNAACSLYVQPIYSESQLRNPPPQSDNNERFYRHVQHLVQNGSLSAAYQQLTEPGLCQTDPLNHFLQIHRDTDISGLIHHSHILQEVRDTTDWDEIFSSNTVFRFLSRRKNGKASDRHGMRNKFIKVLAQDSSFLSLFITCIMIPIGKGLDKFPSSREDSCTGAMLIAPLKPNEKPRPVQIPDMSEL